MCDTHIFFMAVECELSMYGVVGEIRGCLLDNGAFEEIEEWQHSWEPGILTCLLYTSDAADDSLV